ncbi:MAG: M23 family metallopeptidase [Gammaproteobacteria bacterium]|nr:M23 family metallopeptidase [Gammaproteobacteria bacterium]MBU1654218.1 M23 family metallopeptidase [Gammaproteobacteria bacterium]MBU1960878.1 M23 family metallopeptidase [Gammaproteobacteria bacterium]
MNIIFLSQHCKKWGSVEVDLKMIITGLVLLSVLILAAGGWAGYRFAMAEAREGGMASYSDLNKILTEQRGNFSQFKERAEYHLDALALRLGSLQAHVMRLDALGERLTQLGKLDREEFNFNEAPPMGGLEGIGSDEPASAADLIKELDALNATLEDREWKLDLLEAMLMNRKLQLEVQPSGKPVARGWITSRFGVRFDPFSGRQAMHSGVDFNGRPGTEIFTVASGLVVYSGDKPGYGKVVDIKHGNGYVTRYGHNLKNVVSVGDTVTKGQTIALLGSTGRSTGPHVHFEVIKDGQAINPVKYLSGSH